MEKLNVNLENWQAEVSSDQWETDVLKRTVGKITLLQTGSNESILDFSDTLKKRLDQSPFDYVTFRLEDSEFYLATALKICGFSVVDSIIEFSTVNFNNPPKTKNIRIGKIEDLESVIKISQSTFVESRFHKDPSLGISLAESAYASWASNICNRIAADEFFVSFRELKIRGFISIKKKKSAAEIGLIAVDSQFAGKGVGSDLLSSAFQWCKNNDVEMLLVKTQYSNLNAMNLYLKAGFKIYKSYLTFRWLKK